MPRRKRPGFALLFGDTEIARGTESAMKRQKRQHAPYAEPDAPLVVLPLAALKRRREEQDNEEEELRRRTKRLKVEQEEEYDLALARDREREEEERRTATWRAAGLRPEHRAEAFDTLLRKKNPAYRPCLVQEVVMKQ